jgi:hypothetical protein
MPQIPNSYGWKMEYSQSQSQLYERKSPTASEVGEELLRTIVTGVGTPETERESYGYGYINFNFNSNCRKP